MSVRIRSLVLLLFFLVAASVGAAEPERGRLLIIGGGLRPDNLAVHRRMVAYAGGPERARFGLMTMASLTPASAVQLSLTLHELGVPADHIQIINLTPANAATNAFDPEVVERIRSCTGLFFTGGDQRRIVNSVLEADGTERPALKAMREVLARGGVIAGSSAGAAMQGDPMLTVSGLPDDSLDEGMDALDFGLRSHPKRRGLAVTRGLGFFQGGLIDQHFNQFRGRLARLARAATEKRVRFGFGIDENTAMDVAPDGTIEVVGAGCMTVVDTKDATCEDGPLGCTLKGLRLTSLEDGDRFDPKSGEATPAPGKPLIAPGRETNNGNHLITDISGEGAVYYALTAGLADNTRRRQTGVTLRYSGHHGHGYRFTFAKADDTRSYAGYVNRSWCYSVLGIRLDVEPIVTGLRLPESVLPDDLPKGDRRAACEAALFRGLLVVDAKRQFRPADPISRGELATAIAHTIHLEPPRQTPVTCPDVSDASLAEDVEKVVGAGLMALDESGKFRPDATVSRQEAASLLVRLYETSRGEELAEDPIELGDAGDMTEPQRAAVFAAVRGGVMGVDEKRFRPAAQLSREETAAALCQIVGFCWNDREKP